MNNYYSEKLQELKDEISELKIEIDNPIHLSEIVIDIILKYLSEIKIFVLQRGFIDIEEEVYFFKKLKPQILSKLIYYNAVYKIETKKTYGGGVFCLAGL
jgi:predicted membrane GTPase involved in stress response